MAGIVLEVCVMSKKYGPVGFSAPRDPGYVNWVTMNPAAQRIMARYAKPTARPSGPRVVK